MEKLIPVTGIPSHAEYHEFHEESWYKGFIIRGQTTTDEMELAFGKVNNARQWWHGTAYGQLITHEEKQDYKERYWLTTDQVMRWANVVSNIGINTDISYLAQNENLNFTYAQAVAQLVEDRRR
jgi:hypothetical protein